MPCIIQSTTLRNKLFYICLFPAVQGLPEIPHRMESIISGILFTYRWGHSYHLSYLNSIILSGSIPGDSYPGDKVPIAARTVKDHSTPCYNRLSMWRYALISIIMHGLVLSVLICAAINIICKGLVPL